MKAAGTIAAAIAAIAALSVDTAVAGFTATQGAVTLYENSYGGGKSQIVYVKESTNAVARCYNIGDCFDDKASSAIWDLRFYNFVRFYTRENCAGKYVDWATEIKTPAVNFVQDGIDNSVSSIMIVNDYVARTEYINGCRGWRSLADDNRDAAINSTIAALEKTDSAMKPTI